MLARMAGLTTLIALLTLGGGADTIDHDTQGTLAADALVGTRGVDNEVTTVTTADASAELRGSELATGGAVRVDAGYDLHHDEEMQVLSLWLDGGLGKRPALDARRDMGRQRYATTSVGFLIGPAYSADVTHHVTIFRFGFGGDMLWQGDQRRARITADVELFGYCHVHYDSDDEAYCLHVLEMDGAGVSGKQEATVTNLMFARATGIAGHFELGLGLVTDTVAIGNNDQSKDPADWVVTENLPRKTVLAGSVGAVAQAGPLRLGVRGVRTGYVSLDHDLSIEDRASLTASLPIDKHATLSATGFAARTRWWSSAMDPGSSAETGGGEVSVAMKIHAFDVRAATGVARSFYPELDGGALSAPATGFRSSVEVARAIDL